MKSEQVAFAARLRQQLEKGDFSLRPVELVKELAYYGKISVTPQTISGWLHGTHMPKQGTIRALAYMFGLEPHVLQYGGKSTNDVREPQTVWPSHVPRRDRLLFENYLGLPSKQRETARNFIETLVEASARRHKVV